MGAPFPPELFRSPLCQGLHDGYVLKQRRRHALPLLQIRRAIIGKPDFSLAVFRDQNFSGRSMAMLGAASIRGVPPLGFPKISSLVGGIFNPTFAASPP